jgi:hypothetical protein
MEPLMIGYWNKLIILIIWDITCPTRERERERRI